MSDQGREAVRAYYQNLAPHFMDSIIALLAPDDPEAIRREAADQFERLVAEIPYADRPNHVMAESMYFSMGVLAFKEPLLSRGFDLQDLGSAILDIARRNLEGADPSQDPSRTREWLQRLKRDAAQSQADSPKDEFVFEIIDGDDEIDYGMNITSCAICKAYSKHDAMPLVPYMCASDDVVSEALDRGLRRTGTIALGAHKCDFRFRQAGAGHALADQYPDQIVRWIT
jgi:hypothetical protein